MSDLKITTFHKSYVVIFCLFLIALPALKAQNGPFVRLSLGSGINYESKTIDEASFSMVIKNHAIGWGFKNKYAISISEFGALIRQDVGNSVSYINLDAYGLGFAYRTKNNLNLHIAGAYSTIHFSDDWTKQGNFIENGIGVAIGLDKRWYLSQRIDLGLGPHLSFYKTNTYTFTNLGINFWLNFYLFPQK